MRFVGGRPLLDPTPVYEVEARANVSFPDSLLQIVRYHDGASVEDAFLTFPDPASGELISARWEALVPFDPRDGRRGVMGMISGLDARPILGLVPFGLADRDGALCLQFDRQGKSSAVVLVDYGHNDGVRITALAVSFDAFMEKCTTMLSEAAR